MSQNFEAFGKFILLEKLAAGGMAEVFLAKSLGASGVNKFLAVKRILPQYSDNKDFIDMFKEEAKIAVNLNHGSVVSIYEFGIERGQFYLVMEYVEGRNLRQILNELKKKSLQFSIEQIVYMVKEVAAGLDHAHRLIDGTTGKPLNLVHRDMSPQNVMVSFEGEVKVIDFGIAKAETQLEATKTGTLKGKFGYMSPEQADGQPIDSRTDLFSLGIVLWELLANDRLFTSNSEAAILRKIRDCQIPSIRKINPSVPVELENIVNKALARDRSLRYQTAAAFHKDLNRFLNVEFPDFSSQDFAVFVKNAFAEVYSDSKRKLVEYAKVSVAEDKTNVTQTLTYTSSPSQSDHSSSEYSSTGLPPLPGNENEKLNIETDDPVKVDLSNLAGEGGDRTRVRASSSSGATRSRTGLGGTRTQIPINTRSGTKLRKVSSAAEWIVPGVLVVAVIAGTYFVVKNPTVVQGLWARVSSAKTAAKPAATPQPAAQTPTPTPTPNPDPPPSGSEELAATGLVTVTIMSEPMGAEIIVKGKRLNMRTPAQIQLPANENLTLRLEKMGYLANEREVRATHDGETFMATLLAGRMGAINLSLINGGAQPEIEINGTRIAEKLPLRNYRIPAGVPVVIKVQNSFLGLKAEKTVVVRENESKSLELILKPEKTNP